MKKIIKFFKKIYSALFYKKKKAKKGVFEHSLGCVPDPKDNRDLVLGNYLIPQKLPPIIDWYFLIVPVKNQVGPSCVGYSCAGMKEIQEKLEHEKIFGFDGLDLYNRCKKIDDLPGDGTFIRVAMKILENEGGLASDCKYYKIASYTKLNSIEEMKFALVATGPFIAGVDVYENFKALDEKGIIPMPAGNNLGGHAILITGYDDNLKLFRFKNSWGDDWGVKGYAWLTYEFMEKYCHTAWAGVDLKDEVVKTFINTVKLKSDVKEAKNA